MLLRPGLCCGVLLALLALAACTTPFSSGLSGGPQGAGLANLVTGRSATTGCGKVPPVAPGTSDEQVIGAGIQARAYRLHVPRRYQRLVPTPLVLSFHGHGSNAMTQERLTGFSRLADAQRFIVAYPQGVIGPDQQTGWNTGRHKDPTTNDLLFVSNMISHLQSQLCVDPNRIYATGFSNGGGLTAILACVFANRIAAFAPVSGDYYPQKSGCKPARPVSLLEIHGTGDVVNPYQGSTKLHYPSVMDWLDAWVQRDGCTGEPVVANRGADVVTSEWDHCKDGVVLRHVRLLGGPHVWPIVPKGTTGGHIVHFDATGEIWAFFASRSLATSTTSA